MGLVCSRFLTALFAMNLKNVKDFQTLQLERNIIGVPIMNYPQRNKI